MNFLRRLNPLTQSPETPLTQTSESPNRTHKWTTGVDNTDVIDFYNHYLIKRAEKNNFKIDQDIQLQEGDTAALMVIDMQNDFVLPNGRFSVAKGLNMAPKLRDFIQENASNFTKIIFTRDTHPINHCSFYTVKNDDGSVSGPFPPHCVANHEGAAFHPVMKSLHETLQESLRELTNEKVDVVFKGCHNHVDSFGAEKYNDVGYLKKRQLGTCCQTFNFDKCAANTGTFHLRTDSKKWEDYPFDGIKNYTNEQYPDNPLLPTDHCLDSLSDNIEQSIGKPFGISEILPPQFTGTHYIFIVGLAGDYCVKDTAINLSATIRNMKISDKVQVVVLQPYVRYAFLPLQIIGGYQVYSDKVVLNKDLFTISDKEKDINHYLFQVNKVDDVDVVSLLSEEDAIGSKDAVAAITNPKSPNPHNFYAFLTPIDDILTSYKLSGVQILMSDPIFLPSSTAGGNRKTKKYTNKRRKYKTKKSKRNCKRSRKYRRRY